MHRQLVTVEWIRDRDSDAYLSDTTSYTDAKILDAITIISYELCSRVGHDWGDSSAASVVMDGVLSDRISFRGKTMYPPREITSITMPDDSTVPLDQFLVYDRKIISTNDGESQFETLRLLVDADISNWEYDYITFIADLGWTSTPDDVQEAVYRLVIKKLTGSSIDAEYSSSSGGGDGDIKELRYMDKVKVVYQTASTSTEVLGSDPKLSIGDYYADRVIEKYKWNWRGGVI